MDTISLSLISMERGGKYQISTNCDENRWKTSDFHWLAWKHVGNIRFPLIAMKTWGVHQISILLPWKHEGKIRFPIDCHENIWETSDFHWLNQSMEIWCFPPVLITINWNMIFPTCFHGNQWKAYVYHLFSWQSMEIWLCTHVMFGNQWKSDVSHLFPLQSMETWCFPHISMWIHGNLLFLAYIHDN